MHHTKISELLSSMSGPGTDFTSPRNLSLKAALSQNTVGNIIDTGRGDPETLNVLAELLETPRVDVLVMAGWLRPTDVLRALSPEKAKLVLDFRSLEDRQRGIFLGLIDELSERPSPIIEETQVSQALSLQVDQAPG